jgi:hypothetical protein
MAAAQRWLPGILRRGDGLARRLYSSASSLLFDDTQEQFKESVHKFAQETIAPHAAAIDASNHFPKDVNLWKLMGDFNLHGLTAPGLLCTIDTLISQFFIWYVCCPSRHNLVKMCAQNLLQQVSNLI